MEKRHASASIPKKPLAVSKTKKNLPMELDWGEGIPKDRLRYINADEEALIKRFRTSRSARDYAGIPAYADDSASSKGVSRNSGTTTGTTTTKSSTGSGSPSGQGGQSRGPSGAGQGPNSPSSSSSRSSSASSSPGGGYKGQSAASVGVSNAPNAAAQAASNAYRSPQVNTSGGSPNMAASYASQKLNATSNALKAAQAPQAAQASPMSIQGMINSGTATPWGGSSNRYSLTAPNGSYYGPKGAGSLNADARYAAARSVGFTPDPVQRTPGDAEAMGRMMMAESATIRNQYGNPSVPGLMGVGEVMRNRMLSERFPDTVQGVMTQRKQFSPWGDGSYARTPANPMATSIAESILSGESPPTVGTSLNYGNIDTINNKPGYSSAASKAAFNSMPVEARIADARNPNTFSHSFGTIGPASDVGFNGTGKAPTASVSFAATAPSQGPQAIPAPSSTGMLGADSPPQVPSASPGLVPNFRGTAGVASTGIVPGWGYSPLADGRSSSPAASPQVAASDPAPVFSDNPVQGSQNPMQDEGENPQVKRDRQIKYANRGATIGGVIAGPIGTVVGATLGWQMGKTSPQQRQAIASNPQALQANVQSINEMVDQRGGKGNPNLKVTEVGLKDVLENPQKVTANPQAYTSLEQSLAALAQGIDPETGQAI